MTYKNHKQRGFTLIELLVVIGIIAALAAVVIPNVSRFMGSGQESANTAEFANVQTAVDAWFSDPNPDPTNLYADLATPGSNDMATAGLSPDYLRQATTTCDYSWTNAIVVQESCP